MESSNEPQKKDIVVHAARAGYFVGATCFEQGHINLDGLSNRSEPEPLFAQRSKHHMYIF